jgi:shikimate kinase/3-dehydroquinate synthase
VAPLVALTGFMGSGKSSVGALLAQSLGCAFVDLDAHIVESEGMSIADFFAKYGEASFRAREVDVIGNVLLAQKPGGSRCLVLALGGGTLETPAAVAMLEEHGGVIFLDVDGTTAWERARGAGRPLAQNPDVFLRLLDARRSTYEGAADWLVPVGARSPEDIATDLAAIVGSLDHRWSTSWGQQLISTARPSTIVGGAGSLEALAPRAQEAASRGLRIFTLTDANVDAAWGERVAALLGRAAAPGGHLVLPPGEQTKNVQSLQACWEWLAEKGARRDDIVLALGGGVVGDLAGFAAATYQRGVQLWQVPTSLLAQVDSSVGGKTAIDLRAGKNLAGAFYQPSLVVIDPETLATLPDREFANGLGEVVKCGLLSDDGLFGRLEAGQAAIAAREAAPLSEIIRTCVRYKAAVVAEDELDTGRRAVLNLGHTAAHALEVTLGYGRLGHGEAVGLGLLVALRVSEELLGLDPTVRPRTKALVTALGLPATVDLPAAADLQAAAAKDKKVTAGSAGFVGLRAIGDPQWKLALPPGLFMEALEVIRQ